MQKYKYIRTAIFCLLLASFFAGCTNENIQKLDGDAEYYVFRNDAWLPSDEEVVRAIEETKDAWVSNDIGYTFMPAWSDYKLQVIPKPGRRLYIHGYCAVEGDNWKSEEGFGVIDGGACVIYALYDFDKAQMEYFRFGGIS